MAETTRKYEARIHPANVSNLPTVLDTTQVSHVTRMSVEMVRKYVHGGFLSPLRYSPANSWLFHNEEVLRFLREFTGEGEEGEAWEDLS